MDFKALCNLEQNRCLLAFILLLVPNSIERICCITVYWSNCKQHRATAF